MVDTCAEMCTYLLRMKKSGMPFDLPAKMYFSDVNLVRAQRLHNNLYYFCHERVRELSYFHYTVLNKKLEALFIFSDIVY
jgi:hypothetical protein